MAPMKHGFAFIGLLCVSMGVSGCGRPFLLWGTDDTESGPLFEPIATTTKTSSSTSTTITTTELGTGGAGGVGGAGGSAGIGGEGGASDTWPGKSQGCALWPDHLENCPTYKPIVVSCPLSVNMNECSSAEVHETEKLWCCTPSAAP